MSLFLFRTVYVYKLLFHWIYSLNGPLLTFYEKRNDVFEKSCFGENKNKICLMRCPKMMRAGTGNKKFLCGLIYSFCLFPRMCTRQFLKMEQSTH